MTQFFNRTREKEKRRRLRNNMTAAERRLWAKLRNKQLLGYKFRRQYSIGSFVIDFYCPAAKLAIELDGDSHFQGNAPAYDRERQAFIEGFGIRFLRFTNREVFDSLEGVLTTIEQAVCLEPRD